MKASRCLLIALSAVASFSSPIRGGTVSDLILGKRELKTVTVTDFTKEGKAFRKPTPEHPVYYVAISAGWLDLGVPVVGEEVIPRDQANRAVVGVLAKQGYLPVGEHQRPDVIISWKWGTLYPERVDVYCPVDPAERTGAPGTGTWSGTIATNYMDTRLRAFLGGDKADIMDADDDAFPVFRRDEFMIHRTLDQQELIELAQVNLYIAVINAHAPTLRAGKTVPLWSTRVAAPARRYSLTEAFPGMLTMAAPYIGRETAQPVIANAGDRLRPNVEIGDQRVIEYFKEEKPIVKQIGPSEPR